MEKPGVVGKNTYGRIPPAVYEPEKDIYYVVVSVLSPHVCMSVYRKALFFYVPANRKRNFVNIIHNAHII